MLKIIIALITLTFTLYAGTLSNNKDLSLDLRATYLNFNYDGGFSDAETFATSIKLKYSKSLTDSLEVGVAFATVQDLGILDYSDKSQRYMAYMFNREQENFTLLHQAYLKYLYSNSILEIGRFELETPLISSDDYFMLSNSFEGVHISFNEIENYAIKAGYISKMSGSWDVAYDGASFNSMTKQAWAHGQNNTQDRNETYFDLNSDLGADEQGYAFLGLEYTNEKVSIQLYDHLLVDVYNSIFGQIDYTMKIDKTQLLLAGQYIQYDGIGALKNNSLATVNYSTYSAKAVLSNEKMNLKIAYTGTSNEDSLHFFGAHGGYPQFAGGMLVGYFTTYLRDSNIFSIVPSINFLNGKNNLKLTLLYSYYDLNSEYTKNGINGDKIKGDKYMHNYGIGSSYTYGNVFSWNTNIAKRRLAHGDESTLFKTVIAYSF